MQPDEVEAIHLKDHVLFSVCKQGGHSGNSVQKSIQVSLKSQPVAALSKRDSKVPTHAT